MKRWEGGEVGSWARNGSFEGTSESPARALASAPGRGRTASYRGGAETVPCRVGPEVVVEHGRDRGKWGLDERRRWRGAPSHSLSSARAAVDAEGVTARGIQGVNASCSLC